MDFSEMTVQQIYERASKDALFYCQFKQWLIEFKEKISGTRTIH